jgi:hypothetical protein
MRYNIKRNACAFCIFFWNQSTITHFGSLPIDAARSLYSEFLLVGHNLYPKVVAKRADKAPMKLENSKPPHPDDVIAASVEMIETICKARGIQVDGLSDADVDAIWVMAFQEAYPLDTLLTEVFGSVSKD